MNFLIHDHEEELYVANESGSCASALYDWVNFFSKTVSNGYHVERVEGCPSVVYLLPFTVPLLRYGAHDHGVGIDLEYTKSVTLDVIIYIA